MNKKIDIRECEYYGEVLELCTSSCANTYYDKCEKNPNCYYKQMKRLEQENAKLKDTTDSLLNIQYTLADNCNKYYKALEEIKKISKKAFAVCDDDCGNANKFMDIINKVSEVLKDE